MKKILFLNYGFYPANNYGGPVNSIRNLCCLLCAEYECFILTCDHELGETKRLDGINEGWNIFENYKVKYLPDKDINLKNILHVIKEVSPEIVYIQSVFEAVFMLPILYILKTKAASFKLLIAPRGDLCNGAMKKKYKKIPYIYLLKVIGINSENVFFHSTALEETSAIRKYFGHNVIIYQLANVPEVIPDKTFLKCHNNILRIIFLSRIVPKKNLLQAIRIVKKCSNVSFDIYGPIEDKAYWELCKKEIASCTNSNIKYCGVVEHNKIYEVFSKYDLFFLPTFSENYGHVIVEAMQSGCIVLLSDQTPWNDINIHDV